MSELKPVPCAKCGSLPEVQDKRIRFVVICDCETPANYVFGNSVGFLDYIENEEAAQIAFDAINVNELSRTAIEAWNKEQEVLRLTSIANKHETRADELHKALDSLLDVLGGEWAHGKRVHNQMDEAKKALNKSRTESDGK